jgi:transposase InsO family protein
VSLALLSRLFDWRDALVVVRPETLIRWHRAGWRLFWRIKSRPGRPRIPLELRRPIRRMATENRIWGEERIANELLLKLGLRSPRGRCASTCRSDRRGARAAISVGRLFLRNHADVIVACDFFVAVTATFRLLYVFVVIEHGSRRLMRVAVTAHPSAAWTLQQLREGVGFDRAHRYLIHDRDSIFARCLDESIRNLGLTVLKSPPHSPKANAICERVIGTIRRDCLDWLIPLSESHLRSILRAWAGHYNHGRPHMALGPGVPDPPSVVVPSATPLTRHRIGERLAVRARSVLVGLHHEYLLAPA